MHVVSAQQDPALREATASELLTLEVLLLATVTPDMRPGCVHLNVLTLNARGQEEYAMQRSWAEDDDSE